MGIKIGEIDIISQIIDNEFKIKTLSKIVEWFINNNATLSRPSQGDIENMRKEVLEELKNKYPSSGVKLKE